MPDLVPVASLTEATLKQKLQENRRELKRRVESLRTFLWTILEALDNDQAVTAGVGLVVDFAKGIDSVVSQICIAEQMLEQLNGSRGLHLMETTTGRMKA